MNELAKSYLKYTYKTGCTQRLKVMGLNLKNVTKKNNYFTIWDEI